MLAYLAVAAVSDRHRRSEVDATIYVALYISALPALARPKVIRRKVRHSTFTTVFRMCHLLLLPDQE